MVVDREFFDNVGPFDRLRYRIKTDRGQLVDFVIQHETMLKERFHPVVRYDASHGHGHLDILNVDGATVEKRWLPETMTLKDCLSYGAQDLQNNWERYRDRFLEAYK